MERGERAAQQAFELDSEIPASYVLLSNLYVHANYDTTISNKDDEDGERFVFPYFGYIIDNIYYNFMFSLVFIG